MISVKFAVSFNKYFSKYENELISSTIIDSTSFIDGLSVDENETQRLIRFCRLS